MLIYDFGPNKLVRKLRFVANKLESIETLGPGTRAEGRRSRRHFSRAATQRSSSLEHRERQRAVREQRGVKGARVEARSAPLLRVTLDRRNSSADLVRERLPGDRDVAIDLGRDLGIAERVFARR